MFLRFFETGAGLPHFTFPDFCIFATILFIFLFLLLIIIIIIVILTFAGYVWSFIKFKLVHLLMICVLVFFYDSAPTYTTKHKIQKQNKPMRKNRGDAP